MSSRPNFYCCIIGTELLNGRRKDEHFDFVLTELVKRGFELKASFIIKDSPEFMADVYSFIKKDEHSVMFSFGGIGATPDDYTREIAAKVFSDGAMEQNKEAADIITGRFGNEAYPNRIKMSQLPVGAGLLENIVNRIPGFFIEKRFFFMPGFPSMAQHMVQEALDRFYPGGAKKYSDIFTAFCSENDIIDIMHQLPAEIEFSSLPIMDGERRFTELFIASFDEQATEKWSSFFKEQMSAKSIRYEQGTHSQVRHL